MSKKSIFTFNGRASSDWNFYKTSPINFPSPVRDVESKPIPVRNGNLLFDNGRYTNVEITIECWIKSDFRKYYDSFRGFLMQDSDYHRLEDDRYPDEFRMARVVKVEPNLISPAAGSIYITMSCKPQRYLKAGEREIELNFTDDATGGTDFDLYTALDNTIKTEVNALGIPADSRFPYFTLTRDTDYVFQDKPRGADAWIYPNDAGFGYWRYADNSSEIGDKFYGVVTNDSSPFLSIHDDQGEVYTPSYFGTTITNPTKYPASPLIKIYGQIIHVFRTAFGVDADNWVKVLHFGSNADMNDGVLIVDCSNFDFYSHNRMTGESLNLNNVALFNGELTIPPGTHVFRVSNFAPYFTGIDKITLTPNWWTL